MCTNPIPIPQTDHAQNSLETQLSPSSLFLLSLLSSFLLSLLFMLSMLSLFSVLNSSSSTVRAVLVIVIVSRTLSGKQNQGLEKDSTGLESKK